MEKNDFEQLKSSSGKQRNEFVANPIFSIYLSKNNQYYAFEYHLNCLRSIKKLSSSVTLKG